MPAISSSGCARPWAIPAESLNHSRVPGLSLMVTHRAWVWQSLRRRGASRRERRRRRLRCELRRGGRAAHDKSQACPARSWRHWLCLRLRAARARACCSRHRRWNNPLLEAARRLRLSASGRERVPARKSAPFPPCAMQKTSLGAVLKALALTWGRRAQSARAYRSPIRRCRSTRSAAHCQPSPSTTGGACGSQTAYDSKAGPAWRMWG